MLADIRQKSKTSQSMHHHTSGHKPQRQKWSAWKNNENRL